MESIGKIVEKISHATFFVAFCGSSRALFGLELRSGSSYVGSAGDKVQLELGAAMLQALRSLPPALPCPGTLPSRPPPGLCLNGDDRSLSSAASLTPSPSQRRQKTARMLLVLLAALAVIVAAVGSSLAVSFWAKTDSGKSEASTEVPSGPAIIQKEHVSKNIKNGASLSTLNLDRRRFEDAESKENEHVWDEICGNPENCHVKILCETKQIMLLRLESLCILFSFNVVDSRQQVETNSGKDLATGPVGTEIWIEEPMLLRGVDVRTGFFVKAQLTSG